jgi:hypothetical protein
MEKEFTEIAKAQAILSKKLDFNIKWIKRTQHDSFTMEYSSDDKTVYAYANGSLRGSFEKGEELNWSLKVCDLAVENMMDSVEIKCNNTIPNTYFFSEFVTQLLEDLKRDIVFSANTTNASEIDVTDFDTRN